MGSGRIVSTTLAIGSATSRDRDLTSKALNVAVELTLRNYPSYKTVRGHDPQGFIPATPAFDKPQNHQR